MNKEDIETKAEYWDYYRGLLKLNGFDGITDLLTRYKRLEQVQPESTSHEQRITEQDAREIAVNIFGYVGMSNFSAAWDNWFNLFGGRALLAKLNKEDLSSTREPDYKAQRDEFLDLQESNKKLEERLKVACETIGNLKRVNKEWEILWKPIDDLVRPLTALGESVGDVAVEIIRYCLDDKD